MGIIRELLGIIRDYSGIIVELLGMELGRQFGRLQSPDDFSYFSALKLALLSPETMLLRCVYSVSRFIMVNFQALAIILFGNYWELFGNYWELLGIIGNYSGIIQKWRLRCLSDFACSSGVKYVENRTRSSS